MLNFETGVGCSKNTPSCSGNDCESTPDFCIKRGDTKPSFKVSVEDCEGVADLTDENLVLEASMWFRSKLKSAVDSSVTALSFADNLGFDQLAVGDTIVMDRPRNPERMLVTGIDESSKTLTVDRGIDSSPDSWPKGAPLRVFRFQDQPAEIQSFFDEAERLDGTVSEELSDTFMVFNWHAAHTSMPGCYLLEFKLIMMDGSSISWTKKTPLAREGFVISVVDSPNF